MDHYNSGHHRSREETGSGKTKSMLKAIMLMRKSRGSIHKDTENDVRGVSVGGAKEYYNRNKNGVIKNTEKHPRLMTKNTKPKTSEVQNTKRKISTGNRVIDVTKSFSISDLKESNSEPTQSTKPRVLEDRWTTNDRKFVVKEVINTRIPGKTYPEPQTYPRFNPSMFESFDKINILSEKKPVDPFGAKAAAMIWLKRARLARQSDYNPGLTPIIVIQEYKSESDDGDDESEEEGEQTGDESRDKHEEEKVKRNGYQGRLQILTEDIEKENMVESINKIE